MDYRQALIDIRKYDWFKPSNIERILLNRASIPFFDFVGGFDEVLVSFDTDSILSDIKRHPNARSPRHLFLLNLLASLFSLSLVYWVAYNFVQPVFLLLVLLTIILPLGLYSFWSYWLPLGWSLLLLFLAISILPISSAIMGADSDTWPAEFALMYIIAVFVPVLIRRWIHAIATPRYNVVTRGFISTIESLVNYNIDMYNLSDEGCHNRVPGRGRICRFIESIKVFFDKKEYAFVSKKQLVYLPTNTPVLLDSFFIAPTVFVVIGSVSKNSDNVFVLILCVSLSLQLVSAFVHYISSRNLTTNKSSRLRMVLYILACIPVGVGLFIFAGIAFVLVIALCCLIFFIPFFVHKFRDWEARRDIREWEIAQFQASNNPFKWVL